MTAATRHRLTGLEPDNLLAFLALLGLLRALEESDKKRQELKLRPRATWDLDNPPLRPVLYLATPTTEEQVAEVAAEGLNELATAHYFDGQADLNHSRVAARELLKREASDASYSSRTRADLLAALMTDAAIKDAKKEEVIDPTPLCLLFGQGHQHFLDRLANVPGEAAPPTRQRGKNAAPITAGECLCEALFLPWHRSDPTFSFRWDPAEDVRYALLPGDPTVAAYQTGTQHGANRLAAIGLATLTVIPETRAGRVRPAVLGGESSRTGFSIAWPIWRQPARLASIRALLGHPDLRKPGAIGHLGVELVLVAHRISVGKFMNFSRARAVTGEE